jgi:hypothetical protein
MMTFPPPAHEPDLLDADLALVALGQLAGAADRRCLPDVLAAWRRFVVACGRETLLSTPQRFPAYALRLTPQDAAAWSRLVDAALSCARNLHATDSLRHWAVAAALYAQAAANAAAYHGTWLADELETLARNGWLDDDEDLITTVYVDLLASQAQTVGHYGRLALNQTETRRHTSARTVQVEVIR